MENIKKKCIQCYQKLDISNFVYKNKISKTCADCRNINRLEKQCICGKRKETCRLHNPDAYCECFILKRGCEIHGNIKKCPHGKKKYDCYDCFGKGICRPHKKRKNRCKLCKPLIFLLKELKMKVKIIY